MKHTQPDGLTGATPAGISPAAGGVLAVVAIILVAISLRPGIISIGPILPAVIEEFHLSHAAASLLTSIPDVLMGILALPSPWLARRFGRDNVILAALVILSVSILGRALAPTPAVLLIATAGVGTGIAITGALMAGVIKANFPTRAAVFMGIYATALSFGSTTAAAITGPASLYADGWRFAAGLWSAFAVVSVLAWLALTLKERKQAQPVLSAAPKAKLPLGSTIAWLVALYFACDNFLFYVLVSWLSPMYQELGRTTTIAGFILASFTAVFMFSTPVFGYLSKSHDRRVWLAVCSLIAVAGLAGIVLVPNLAPFFFVPLTGIGLGGGFTLGMTLPLDNTDSVEEANVWNSFVLTVGYLIAATGPLIVGRLRDFDGNFRSGMWVCAAVAGIMLLVTPFLKPKAS